MSNSPLIALTGATGFIGRRLVPALVAGGARVRALARAQQLDTPAVEWVAGDLAQPQALQRLVANADVVIHLAASVRGARWADFLAPNVEGVERLVSARASAASSSRLLHISSLAASAPELSYYAASKAAGESVALAAGATVLRPPAVYGPGDQELLPLLTGLAAGRGVIPGHSGRFSLIFVDDLVAAIRAAIDTPLADGAVFTVDDGQPAGYDWNTVIDTIAALRRAPVRPLRVPRSLLMTAAFLASETQRLLGRAPMLTPGKVRELFHPAWVCGHADFTARTGWLPQVSLAAGLRATLPALSTGGA